MNVKSTALRFLIITATCIFVAEAFIMIFLEAIEPLGYWTTVFLDSLLILFCTIPALYVWLYRTIIRHISERNEAQRDVYESQQKLSFHLQNTPVPAAQYEIVPSAPKYR